jgi:hypothetical protein
VLALVPIDPGELVEVADLAGYLHGQRAGVEARNPFDSTLTRENCAAECVPANSVRTNDTHSRDYDPLQHLFSDSLDSIE